MVAWRKYLFIFVVLSASTVGAWAIQEYRRLDLSNSLINTPESIPDEQIYDPRVLFSKAFFLTTQDDSSGALSLYSQIISEPYQRDPKIWVRAQFNIAQIYFEQALQAKSSADHIQRAQMTPLLELSAAALKSLLQVDADDYQARLMLEMALREMPKTNKIVSSWKESRSSVFSKISGVAKGGP